jgi:hypothetical protein
MPAKLFDIEDDSKVKAGSNGYYYVCTDPPHPYGEVRGDRKKKYIYLHRALLEQKLGRYLENHEQAHHIDDNKENNIPSNLELKELGEHQKEHAHKTKFWKASPMNKPNRKIKKASIIRVIGLFLQ